MANIVLKDKNGANVVYKNVDYVSFQTLEGGTVRFNERAADIISVTELPTEAINDNAIYRLTTKDDNGNTVVEFYVHENSGEWIEVAEGAKMSDLVVTENGEYSPVEDEDGFAKVTVDIDTFTDVEEFPMENIDQEAIYRVIRQDEETGTTYTTYGIFDADDTKTVLEYNAEEGWVECGAGKGEAVLAELIVTENGVYDNPQIVVEPNIAAGNTIQFKKNIAMDDIPTELRPTDQQVQKPIAESGNWLWMLMMMPPAPDSMPNGGLAVMGMHSMDGSTSNIDDAYVYLDEYLAPTLGVQLGCTNPGWYHGVMADGTESYIPIDEPPSMYIEEDSDQDMIDLLVSLKSIFGSAAPADGYNPVVVNIPNADTIVEVDELPATAEADKIYKQVVVKDTDATIYVCDAEKGLVTLSGYQLPYNYNCYVVDSVPASIPAPDTTTLTINIALVLETGEAYTNMNSGDIIDIRNESVFLKDLTYGGYSTDTSNMTEVGCYYFLLDTMTNYGVLADPDNKIYEYNENGWEESGAGYRLMVDVAELPAENIVDNKVYCIRNIIEARTGVYIMQSDGSGFYFDVLMNALVSNQGGTCVTEYYVVDELPTNPTPSVLDKEAFTVSNYVYILNGSEDAPVVSTDGSTYVTFGEYYTSLNMGDPGEYKGLVANDTDATETGYYTVIRERSISYTYGIPNSNGNKTIYEYGTEWTLAKDTVEQVEALPTESVAEETIYMIPGTDTTGATVGIVDTTNAKTIMVYRNGAWVKFVEETAAESETPVEGDSTTTT